jgi:hypothetical protein
MAYVIHDLAHPESGERAFQLARHAGMAHRVAANVRLVHDGAVPRHVRTTLAAPRERRVHYAALRHESRAVSLVESEIGRIIAELVTEELVAPLELPDERLRVRIQHELVGVEAMPLLGRIEAVHAIRVYRPRPRIRKIAVPDFVGVLGQRDALELTLAARIEQAQLDFRRIGGEQREVDAKAVPRCPQRVREAFGYAGAVRASAPLVRRFGARFGHHDSRLCGRRA